MKKILFMNFSPNKNGNTYRIGKELLGHIDYDTLQMVDYKIHQYGQVDSGDQISIKKLDSNDSLFFNHQDPNMVEWFDNMVKQRREIDDFRKEKKNW